MAKRKFTPETLHKAIGRICLYESTRTNFGEDEGRPPSVYQSVVYVEKIDDKGVHVIIQDRLPMGTGTNPKHFSDVLTVEIAVRCLTIQSSAQVRKEYARLKKSWTIEKIRTAAALENLNKYFAPKAKAAKATK